MPRGAPQGLDVFPKALRFAWGTVPFVHYRDPVRCLPGDKGQALMKPMGPLLRRKLQDRLAKAKELNDSIAKLPLRQHRPEDKSKPSTMPK